MTAKRIVLSILSLLAIAAIGLSLMSSWSNPQEQTRLDLLQTDLILQATEWQGDAADNAAIRQLLFDGEPKKVYKQALESYQEARASNVRLIAELSQEHDDTLAEPSALQKKRSRKQNLVNELDVHIGLLKVQTGDVSGAIATWQSVTKNEANQRTSMGITAEILQGLWSSPIMLLPNAEGQVRRSLSGWYRHIALEQLYRAQQRLDLIPTLQKQQQLEATSAVNRLLIANAVPLLGGILGILLWIFLGVQWLFFRSSSPFYKRTEAANQESSSESESLRSRAQTWTVPWGGETVWEVMVLWFTSFIVVSQLILPLVFSAFRIGSSSGSSSYTYKALLVLLPYIFSMLPILAILQICLQGFRPLPSHWFRFNLFSWRSLVWGVGGYLAAVPLVVIVSALSEQLLQGQGGGNPLLPILVESQDNLAKLILWSTLAIAAPFFEELLFRGFLLPSLTKFMSYGSAIALSAFCFALAHLNLADLIPLTVLGMVLGFIYVRSNNLFAPMLVHCLWNSGSFVALLALGGN
ncbi:type II CAAX endopeptidase family protein [Tumidithrix elongata RA019]|uniref:Type II CAAX endopeptidase family protein n=1 Tax=Tumidithrix elongata BACA0141 TaxID=2716417 RepID=A0AAW9PWG2_9CYAN|nr:type II CAAX endopeptidase family protein [Tumidithrix elongata RA019]